MCVVSEPSRPCTAPLWLEWPATHDPTAPLQVLRSQLLANRLLPEVSHAVVATQNAHAREGREEASIDLRQMERHFLSLVEVLAGQQSAGFGQQRTQLACTWGKIAGPCRARLCLKRIMDCACGC